MNARLSVLRTLKREIDSGSGLCTLTGTLKRTGKRTARLHGRLSDQPFWQHPLEIFMWSRMPAGAIPRALMQFKQTLKYQEPNIHHTSRSYT